MDPKTGPTAVRWGLRGRGAGGVSGNRGGGVGVGSRSGCGDPGRVRFPEARGVGRILRRWEEDAGRRGFRFGYWGEWWGAFRAGVPPQRGGGHARSWVPG